MASTAVAKPATFSCGTTAGLPNPETAHLTFSPGTAGEFPSKVVPSACCRVANGVAPTPDNCGEYWLMGKANAADEIPLCETTKLPGPTGVCGGICNATWKIVLGAFTRI